MKKLTFIFLLAISFTTALAQSTPPTEGEPTVPPTGIAPVVPPTGSGAVVPDSRTKKICDKLKTTPGFDLQKELDTSIIPCGRIIHQCDGDSEEAKANDQCEFKHLFVLVNSLVKRFILVVFAPLLVVVLMYIGFLFIKEQAGALVKAKALLSKVLVGTFFVLGAWLIVNFILNGLNVNDTIKSVLTNSN